MRMRLIAGKYGIIASPSCLPGSVKPRISADIYYRLPNLRAVYVHFTGSIRNFMKGGRKDTVYGWRLALYKLSKASFKDW